MRRRMGVLFLIFPLYSLNRHHKSEKLKIEETKQNKSNKKRIFTYYDFECSQNVGRPSCT